MPGYRIRPATLDDVDVLVHHRVAMFQDMGRVMDADAVGQAFRTWVTGMLPAGTYRGWVVETASGQAAPSGSAAPNGAQDGQPGYPVAGGGITVLPWPPGPGYPGDRLAFVYNVYTEPEHRRRGLARMVMGAIHAWCREEGIRSVALNASLEGQPLYESLGYQPATSPMMTLNW